MSDIGYIVESVTSWEKESGSVAVGLQCLVWLLHNIDSNVKDVRNNKCLFACPYFLLRDSA